MTGSKKRYNASCSREKGTTTSRAASGAGNRFREPDAPRPSLKLQPSRQSYRIRLIGSGFFGAGATPVQSRGDDIIPARATVPRPSCVPLVVPEMVVRPSRKAYTH